MIRREKRRQSSRTYSVAGKRPCLETGSLEAPVTPDSTIMDDLGEGRSNSSGRNTPERLQNEDSNAPPPPLIDLSRTPQEEEPAVVDLTGDDNEEDELLFQTENHFFHAEEGIEHARQVAAAVAMAALSDEWRDGGVSEGRHQPMRGTQAIEVVDSDDGDDDDDDDDDEIEELPQFDPTGQSYPVIARSLSSSREKSQSSNGIMATVTCPVCMDTADQILSDKRKLVSTTCGHVFCGKCIRSAIQRQHSCPTCRKRLSLKQFHPIYLT